MLDMFAIAILQFPIHANCAPIICVTCLNGRIDKVASRRSTLLINIWYFTILLIV